MTISGTVLIFFIAISLAHLAAEATHSATGRYLTKPLLIPALILYYAATTDSANPWLIAALFCGWLGDVFLMLPSQYSPKFFLAGLGAFLFGHIAYSALFITYWTGIENVPAWGWAMGVVYVAAGVAAFRFIVPHAGPMKPAVIAYIIAIVLMGLSAIIPLGNVKMTGALTVMIGAFIFMLSDSIIACQRFVRNVPLEGILTMVFYLTGQFLLVQGYLWF